MSIVYTYTKGLYTMKCIHIIVIKMTKQKSDEKKETEKIWKIFKNWLNWSDRASIEVTNVRLSQQNYVHADVIVSDVTIYMDEAPEIIQSLKPLSSRAVCINVLYILEG